MENDEEKIIRDRLLPCFKEKMVMDNFNSGFIKLIDNIM